MNTFIYIGFYLLLALGSYLLWRKNKDKDYIWFSGISIVVVIVNILRNLLYPQLSEATLLITRGFFIIINIVIVCIVIRILLKRK